MANSINSKVNGLINELEEDHNIEIICMVECGSRAYGIHSSKSDFDIYYVYIQRDQRVYQNAYLDYHARMDRLHNGLHDCKSVRRETLRNRKVYHDGTVIEHHGWDITKAIKNLNKMNPTIVEWVYSPKVYYDDGNFIEQAKELLCSQGRVWPLLSHYRGLARTHNAIYLQNQDYMVPTKQYMACVRGCIMFKWLMLIQPENWAPFIELDFRQVVNELENELDYNLIRSVRSLVQSKKSNKNNAEYERDDDLDELIDEVIVEQFDRSVQNPRQKFYNKLLDSYFKQYFNNLNF